MRSIRHDHLTPSLLILALLITACVGTGRTPTKLPESTDTPPATQTLRPQRVTVTGPDCPDEFEEQGESQLQKDAEIAPSGRLTLTLGATPSIPCGWRAPAIDDPAVVSQVDHLTKWPAEGVTPVPGAPGVEIWVFEALAEGESTISWRCTCLGEEGTEEEVTGTFSLNVTAQ